MRKERMVKSRQIPGMDVDQLKQAVEGQHGGTATLLDALPVKEAFGGKTVFEAERISLWGLCT